MIENALAVAVAAHLEANKAPHLSAWSFRAFDSIADAAPALAVVRVQNVASRVSGTNLLDADLEIALRTDAAENAAASLDAAHAYAFAAIRSDALRLAVNIAASSALHLYTVHAAAGDTDTAIDGDGTRSRRITARAVALAKTLS